MTLLFHKIAIMLRMVLISIIHIADKKRNITNKFRGSCYTKYRVHLCNDNIGIRKCTKPTL